MQKLKLILLIVILGAMASSVLAIGMRGERYAIEAMEYYQRGQYSRAIEKYLLADQSAAGMEPLWHYWLGKLYLNTNDKDNARLRFNRYLEFGEATYQTEVQTLLSIMDRQSKIFSSIEVSDLPRYIYSRNSDYGALMSPDGNHLYFASLRPASYEKENIWRSEIFASGWGRPELVQGLNTDKNEAIGSFSNDGSIAYLSGNYERGKIDGDIYRSYLRGNRWSSPENITAVNSPQVEIHPSVFDDKWMFFASSREGGFGGMDIWVSEYIDGDWSLPQNLGPMINTPGNEQSPFMDFDGKTLFFASDTHPGLGAYDLFKTVKIGDTWQSWSIPENLGIPANSVRDDRFFFHQKDSNQAFITTDRQGTGFEKFLAVSFEYTQPQSYLIRDPDTGEIISVDFGQDEDASPGAPFEVSLGGRVTDEDGNPIMTSIVFTMRREGFSGRYVVQTDADGRYRLNLPAEADFDVVVSEEGYMIFTTTYRTTYADNTLNIVLQKLAEERIFVLENIQFEFDSAVLTQASLEILNNTVITLLNNPDIRVEISGHTCNMGSASYNLRLSNRRAASVVNYLVSKGIERTRLQSIGYGLTRPTVSNNTLAGRIQNRRVEFRVLKSND